MDIKELKRLLTADYQRIIFAGKGKLLYALFWDESFQITFWFRICEYLSSKGKFAKIYYMIARLRLKHLQHLTGIQLYPMTQIDGGLRFPYYGSIVINHCTVIGKDVTIYPNVVIGSIFYGQHVGVPTIGNNVVIFPGAKIIGNVHIGNNAVIGANAVVTRDVPENAVAAGIPAKIVSLDSNKCFDKFYGEIFFKHGGY